MDPAAWAESIPFAETRDYVQKVLSNATYYALLLDEARPEATSLRARLGPPVGPRARSAPAADGNLP
jgi:soluble lytic murein transglycosylase